MLLLLLEVLQPVLGPVRLAVRGAGEGGGAGDLTHGAQRVGLLGGRGLVTPGDGGVDHSVGPRHHLELLSLTHLTTAGSSHRSSVSIWVFLSPGPGCSVFTVIFDLRRREQGQGPAASPQSRVVLILGCSNAESLIFTRLRAVRSCRHSL